MLEVQNVCRSLIYLKNGKKPFFVRYMKMSCCEICGKVNVYNQALESYSSRFSLPMILCVKIVV